MKQKTTCRSLVEEAQIRLAQAVAQIALARKKCDDSGAVRHIDRALDLLGNTKMKETK